MEMARLPPHTQHSRAASLASGSLSLVDRVQHAEEHDVVLELDGDLAAHESFEEAVK